MQRVGALGAAFSRLALAALVATASGIGCRRAEKSDAKPAADAEVASPDATAPDAGPSYQVHTIARVHSYAARIATSNEANPKVMLDGGMLVYEVADGTAKVLGDRSGYAAFFLRTLDEAPDLAGYNAAASVYRRLTFTENGLVTSNSGAGFRWTGAAWQKLEVAPGLLDEPERSDGIPKELRGRDDVRCLKAPSFGAKTDYAVCKTWRQTTITTVWKKTGDEWTSFGLGENENRVEAMAVGSDERPWLAMGELGLFRMARDSADLAKAEKMPAPELPTEVARTSYDVEEMGSVANGDPDSPRPGAMRYFSGLRLRTSTLDGNLERVDRIVPLANGEAYVFARENGGQVLLHFRKSQPGRAAPPVLVIGSEADQRAEILNARPLRGWIGRCPHVLVIGAREKTDGSFSSDALFAREKELTTALSALAKKSSKGKRVVAPAVAIVEGRSGGRRVAGALVWRAVPEMSEDLIDKLATELGARFTTNPAAPAEATCTPPVIDRAKELAVAADDAD